MDCKEFREILDLYLDGELSSDASVKARLHVTECSRCSRAERELLKLRSALKHVFSQYQPPPDLASAVHRISQPRWRKVFDIADRIDMSGDGKFARWLWGTKVRLPVPIFVLLLIALVSLGVLTARFRISSIPSHQVGMVISKSDGERTSGQLADLSRFDHGGRASLYKVTR